MTCICACSNSSPVLVCQSCCYWLLHLVSMDIAPVALDTAVHRWICNAVCLRRPIQQDFERFCHDAERGTSPYHLQKSLRGCGQSVMLGRLETRISCNGLGVPVGWIRSVGTVSPLKNKTTWIIHYYAQSLSRVEKLFPNC